MGKRLRGEHDTEPNHHGLTLHDYLIETLECIRDLARENMHPIDGYSQIAEWADAAIDEAKEGH